MSSVEHMQRQEKLGLNKETTNATDRNFLSETIVNILLPDIFPHRGIWTGYINGLNSTEFLWKWNCCVLSEIMMTASSVS